MFLPLLGLIAVMYFSLATAELHPCHEQGNCTCTSLRDSDCYCNNKEGGEPVLPTLCNCTAILEECWESHTTFDFDLAAECSKGTTSSISTVLYTTSLSREGIHAMKLFKKVMEVAEKWIDFKVIFLLDHVGYWPDVTTVVDSPETDRDKLILCANYIDPTPSMFFPFVYCLGLNVEAEIESEHIRGCAIEHDYDYEELEACVHENGQDLLGKDLIHAIRDIPNPTVVLDHSQMLSLNDTDTAKTILETICYTMANPTNDYSFPVWIFTLVSCAAISVVLVLWVVRKPSSKALDSLMQLFFESAYLTDEEPGELALRRWRDGRIREGLLNENNNTTFNDQGHSENDSSSIEV